MPEYAKPTVGYVDIADPRLNSAGKMETVRTDGSTYAAALEEAGLDVVTVPFVVDSDAGARQVLKTFAGHRLCGLLCVVPAKQHGSDSGSGIASAVSALDGAGP